MAIAIVDSDAVGFADGNGGHLYTIPFGAPAVGNIDTLYINSNTIVSSITSSGGAAWTQRVNATDQQGAYIYDRKATGGEPATITVTTSGDHPTTFEISRISGADAFSAGGFVRANNSNDTQLPATTTGLLAASGMALFAFAALHNFDGALAVTPVWTNSFNALETANNGAPGSSAAVVGFTGSKLNVGTASETVNSVTWTNPARNRYALWVAYTAAAVADTVVPDGIAVPVALGAPAVVGVGAVVPDGIPVPVALGTHALTTTSAAVPDGIAVPVAVGSPALVDVGIIPDGIAVPVTPGSPTVVGPVGPAADELMFPAVQSLLVCLCAALNDLPNPPGICCLRVGDSVVQDMDINLDECCKGQAYVRPAGFYMTGDANSPFPSPSTDAAVTPCGVSAWGLQIEIGVFRCIPTGRPLTCADWETITLQHLADAKAMREALCCWGDQYDPQSIALGTWNPVGPSGGCIGSTWTVSIQIDNCGEC